MRVVSGDPQDHANETVGPVAPPRRAWAAVTIRVPRDEMASFGRELRGVAQGTGGRCSERAGVAPSDVPVLAIVRGLRPQDLLDAVGGPPGGRMGAT